MAGLRDMINRYTAIAKVIPEQRQKLALIYAHDAHAITANRVQNTGTDARGNKFKLYSERPFNLGLLNPTDFNAPSRVAKFKKDAAKGLNNGSYRAFRAAYGLPTDKRTLTFDGDMWQSIEQVVVFHDEYKTIVEIRSKDAENTRKVNSNSRIVGINILSFGKNEKDFLTELNKERINKLLND
jgi:hypothetical protein